MAKFLTQQRFWREWNRLSPSQQRLFEVAWRAINASLNAGRGLPPPPLVQKITDHEIFEVRWAADGRATFHIEYDDQKSPIIVWRRIGNHSILKQP